MQGITDLITVPGLINLDFADVRTIMKDAGSALMGIGVAGGENRAVEAAQGGHQPAARGQHRGRQGHPVQHHRRRRPQPVRGQRGGRDHPSAADADGNIIFGAVIDAHLGDEVRVTVIATGFDGPRAVEHRPAETQKAPAPDIFGAEPKPTFDVADDVLDIPSFLKDH